MFKKLIEKIKQKNTEIEMIHTDDNPREIKVYADLEELILKIVENVPEQVFIDWFEELPYKDYFESLSEKDFKKSIFLNDMEILSGKYKIKYFKATPNKSIRKLMIYKTNKTVTVNIDFCTTRSKRDQEVIEYFEYCVVARFHRIAEILNLNRKTMDIAKVERFLEF